MARGRRQVARTRVVRASAASMPLAPRPPRIQSGSASSATNARRHRTRDRRRHRTDHEDPCSTRNYRQGCAPVLSGARSMPESKPMPESKWPIIWNARWIWAAPPAPPVSPIAPAGVPPKATWNRFCYLRRTIELNSVPASAPARVTADSRFVLFVNGVELVRGPARSVPERLAWTEIDLAPLLRPGRNAIAALARFYGLPGPWWRPAPPSFLIGFGSFAFESPAIGLLSDASWKRPPAPSP